jgi:hypothetical protein
MQRQKLTQLRGEVWSALALYGFGCASIGFLLAIPRDNPQLLLGGLVSLGISAFAGAIAAQGAKVPSFIVGAIGAYVLAGTLGWAISMIGPRGCAAVSTIALIWGSAWLVTQVEEENAFLLLAVLMVLAIVGGASNSGILTVGILFTFATCTSSAIGEHFADQLRSRSLFGLFSVIGGIGLLLGWLLRRNFWG